ncbi:MAG: aminoacyl-tRNA hydrolase [Bacteroidota bacterium]
MPFKKGSRMLNWLKRIFIPQPTKTDPMKYLIVGLGNVGAKYDNTRHNIGFDVVDYLAKEHEATWSTEQLGEVTEFRHKGRIFVLLKPSTYMNLSGKSVRYWLQKKKIEKSNLLVILDDLNLPFQAQRLRGKGSDGGHNGLKDIDKMTGGNNYARLRLGIGNDYSRGKQANFVLGEWSNEEQAYLPEIITHAADTIKAFATIGLARTMSKFNKKGGDTQK